MGLKQAEDEYGAITRPGTFRIERLLPGPIERVWAYMTEPEKRRSGLPRAPWNCALTVGLN
jgi:uncharacterized protein YndB with AHSA1/START domain